MDRKTLSSKGKCHCCGQSVDVKVNKNGNLYYFCKNFLRDETGKLIEDHNGCPIPCNGQARYGSAFSRKMIAKNAVLERQARGANHV